MRPLPNPHIQSEPRRQRLLKPHSHTKPNHGRERAVVDRWGQLDEDPRSQGGGVVGDLDMREVDDGELAKGERMFGVRNGGDQVCGRGAGQLQLARCNPRGGKLP